MPGRGVTGPARHRPVPPSGRARASARTAPGGPAAVRERPGGCGFGRPAELLAGQRAEHAGAHLEDEPVTVRYHVVLRLPVLRPGRDSGTNWGRRLRLDAAGVDSDGGVRILGGRALSWRATVASGTSPASRAAPRPAVATSRRGRRSALIAGLSSDGPTREGERLHDPAGRGIPGLRHPASVRTAPGAAVGCRGCAGGAVRARPVGEPVRLRPARRTARRRHAAARGDRPARPRPQRGDRRGYVRLAQPRARRARHRGRRWRTVVCGHRPVQRRGHRHDLRAARAVAGRAARPGRSGRESGRAGGGARGRLGEPAATRSTRRRRRPSR